MPTMRRASRVILSVLASIPLMVSAPALAQSPSPVPVLDVEWTLTHLDGEAVPADPAITATFASSGTLSGTGGCNGYSATWTSNGVELGVSDLLATFASCGAEVDARESSYFALIQEAASWSLDGSSITVTTTDGSTLVFGGDAATTDGLALVGDWTLTTVDDEAPPRDMVVTLSIAADGTLSGAACNQYNASYTATESGDLTVDPIIATRMSCGEAQDGFEAAYLDGLQGATGWGTQSGRLTLFGTAELVFGDGSAVDATLDGQEWLLTAIDGEPVDAAAGVSITFGADGTVNGSGGCNRFRGPYTVDGDTLSIGPLAATRMACGEDIGDLETRYLGALEAAFGFAISGQDMVISTAADGTLEFSTSAGPVEPIETPAASEAPLATDVPEPSAVVVAGDIVGSWKMTGYAGSTLPGTMLAIDITFAEDGSFSGFGGCNDYLGSWTLDGTSLTISGFESASSGTCDQIAQGLETGYFSLMPFLDTAELGADGSLSLASSFAPAQGFVFARAD
jgi:heat shock protein HslJ